MSLAVPPVPPVAVLSAPLCYHGWLVDVTGCPAAPSVTALRVVVSVGFVGRGWQSGVQSDLYVSVEADSGEEDTMEPHEGLLLAPRLPVHVEGEDMSLKVEEDTDDGATTDTPVTPVPVLPRMHQPTPFPVNVHPPSLVITPYRHGEHGQGDGITSASGAHLERAIGTPVPVPQTQKVASIL